MIIMKQATKTYETVQRKGFFRKHRTVKTAVSDLSLEIRPGEIVGLLGLNGAGKTTTIKMLSTLLEPTEGTITVDNLDIRKDRRRIQSMINVITGSERMLYWRLTGMENLQYFGRLYGLTEPLLQSRAEELLDTVGLSESADIPVEQYSKGMKQRLQIARGLINDPRYVFLDEPTIGLDAPVARQLRSLVRQLASQRGKGLLLTSHYLQEVEELCDRVYVIDRGRLLMTDSPQAIIRRTSGLEQLRLTTDGLAPELRGKLAAEFRLPLASVRLEIEEGSAGEATVCLQCEDADSLIPAVIPWLAQAGVRVNRLSVDKPSLEDAIVRLAEGGAARERLLESVSC